MPEEETMIYLGIKNKFILSLKHKQTASILITDTENSESQQDIELKELKPANLLASDAIDSGVKSSIFDES